MVADAFGTLLQELGKIIKIPTLEPDQNNSCLVKFPNAPTTQFEMDRSNSFLIIGCDLGEIPLGRYRETLFKEALIANGMPYPRNGDFAYSKQTDHLILTAVLPLKDLTGDKVAMVLLPFLEKAKIWQEALSKNEIPSRHGSFASKGSGMFGLK